MSPRGATLDAPAAAAAAAAAPPAAALASPPLASAAALLAPAAAPAAAPSAEPEEEVLEIVDDSCSVIGRELRGEIHRRGLLHRAVYVWVFDRAGRLLLQRRSWEKKIGPGQWDLSTAEHLSIGEAVGPGALAGGGCSVGGGGGSELPAGRTRGHG
jgi:uncharacterized membrane protein YgcG